MEHEITCQWRGGIAFEADVLGKKIALDGDPEFGGADDGVRPKPLILAALAGCTGMDVVSILAKMRQNLTWFNVRVKAPLTESEPVYYSSFALVYEFRKSDKLDDTMVRKAIALSQERYCGVSALLQRAGPVIWEISYID